MEEPWAVPPACTPLRMRSAIDGAAPRLSTDIALFYDEDYLSVLFTASDDFICASYLEHDAPLYEEDVVEIFVAPATLTSYFEIEVNPRATIFDALVESPHGTRETMHVERSWTCEGLVAAVRVQEASGAVTRLDTIVRIPFFALERGTPADGETWRCNFYRIDRHPELGDEYSAWQPTRRKPADFHVPSAFGEIRFAR